MTKNLVIVESPAKAKTIAQYLGKDFVVKSSFGHVRDLPSKGLNVDINNNFEPTYEIPAEKSKVVRELRAAAKNHEVWLASDEDREGEAIAWHLTKVLKLDPKKTKRIVFHEITKSAIEEAIKNPRTINIKLVHAQQARRILDRLVGYELSPVLWKKVRVGLSAGRVQSVAVRLIVEREREIRNFKPDSNYKITATFITRDKKELSAELGERLADADKAKSFLAASPNKTFTVASIDQKPTILNPLPPFTTSTLQQEAGRRLGFSVKQTMTLAQQLYESGHITYMRTDSTNLSVTAQKDAKAYIIKNLGKDYAYTRQYKTKTAGAQEAHEAIRPTSFMKTEVSKDRGAQKLYRLIWQHALASQMAPARVNRTEVRITASPDKNIFVAKGEVLIFDGFMKVYGETKDDVILPNIKQNEKLILKNMIAIQTYSRAPARYSEATLVRKLEELGIGRPSTYAPTISTIQSRGYIEKKDLQGQKRTVQIFVYDGKTVKEESKTKIIGADRDKLVPTDTAEVTTDFLVKYFANILDYKFTADIERKFDEIAKGKQQWTKMLADFYKDFHPLVERSEQASRSEASQMRKLGTDPATNKPVFARYGRYGAMLQLGETEDKEKPQFASLPPDTKLETITLDQALKMFKLPRVVGKTTDGQEIIANIGRFGPYLQIANSNEQKSGQKPIFVSIAGIDPHTITETEARKLYEEKIKQEKEKNIANFGKIKILKGPYGPYITDGKKNAKVPDDINPKKLTEDQATKILTEASIKKPFRRRKAKK